MKASLAKTVSFTHLGLGRARIEEVASNRRIVGENGKIKYTRTNATRDPWLRTVSFWDADQPLATLHYYATHPITYYGDGRVSSDFCGLARAARARDDEKVAQIYYTGCAGNITAGKCNDGSKGLLPSCYSPNADLLVKCPHGTLSEGGHDETADDGGAGGGDPDKPGTRR